MTCGGACCSMYCFAPYCDITCHGGSCNIAFIGIEGGIVRCLGGNCHVTCPQLGKCEISMCAKNDCSITYEDQRIILPTNTTRREPITTTAATTTRQGSGTRLIQGSIIPMIYTGVVLMMSLSIT